MRTRKPFLLAAMAAVVLTAVSTNAEAFCHRYRSIPVWYGVYYPNCGPCGGCIMPYVASGAYCGYGYCGIGCGYGCGYGCGSACAAPRGYSYGCGVGCAKKSHRFAAHRAWKRYLRGCGSCLGGYDDCGGCYASCSSGGCGGCGDGGCYGCGDGGCSDGGCYGGSCGDGGCAGCNTSGGGSGEEVLYDGPAPTDDAPPMPHDPSASVRHPKFLMTSLENRQADGSAEFARGLDAFGNGSLSDALQQFEAAAAAEPDNALFHYYRALAMHDLYGAEVAAEARQQAVEAELREPVKGWGKRMERVQGRARVWVEKARRQAGLVR